MGGCDDREGRKITASPCSIKLEGEGSNRVKGSYGKEVGRCC